MDKRKQKEEVKRGSKRKRQRKGNAFYILILNAVFECGSRGYNSVYPLFCVHNE
jgi:hypothetical protein